MNTPDYIMLCKQVRSYIAANPGSTAQQIITAIPKASNQNCFFFLRKRKMLRFEGGGVAGAARWFVVPIEDFEDEEDHEN